MKCQKCSIEYTDNSDNYENEYSEGCPLCSEKHKTKMLYEKLNIVSKELTLFKTCDECQRKDGFCDRDRNTCPKLKNIL
jgi:hypothetical protein